MNNNSHKIINILLLVIAICLGFIYFKLSTDSLYHTNEGANNIETFESKNKFFKRGYKTELEEWDGTENVNKIEESREKEALKARKILDDAAITLDAYNQSEKSIIEIKKDLQELLNKYKDKIVWVNNGALGPRVFIDDGNKTIESLSYDDYKCDFPLYQIYRLQLDSIIDESLGKDKYLQISEHNSNETNYLLKDRILDVSYFENHIRIATSINNYIFTTNIDQLFHVGGQLLDTNIQEKDYRIKQKTYKDREQYQESEAYDYEFLKDNNIKNRSIDMIKEDLFKNFEYTWMVIEHSGICQLVYTSRETDDWYRGPARSKILFDLSFYDVSKDNKTKNEKTRELMTILKDELNEKYNRDCWHLIDDKIYGYTLINLLLINNVSRTYDGDISVKFLIDSNNRKEIFWYHKYNEEIYNFLKQYEHKDIDSIVK